MRCQPSSLRQLHRGGDFKQEAFDLVNEQRLCSLKHWRESRASVEQVVVIRLAIDIRGRSQSAPLSTRKIEPRAGIQNTTLILRDPEALAFRQKHCPLTTVSSGQEKVHDLGAPNPPGTVKPSREYRRGHVYPAGH